MNVGLRQRHGTRHIEAMEVVEMTELTWEEVAALETDGTPTDALADAVLADVYETRIDHEFVVRDAIARIRSLQTKRERLKQIRQRVVSRYDDAIRTAEADEERLRQSVQTYIERFNDGKAVSFPDVGGAHLRTVNKGGKPRVADPAALEEEALARGLDEQAVYDRTFNATKALEILLDQLGARATPDGSLVLEASGEMVDLPGVAVLPESKSVTVKGAA